MMTKMLCSLLFLAGMLSQWSTGTRAADDPVFEKLTIPPYPYLARLNGTEGTVGVSLTLDPECSITNTSVGEGSPRLVDAVISAVRGDGSLHLRFRPCSYTHTRAVQLSFVFVLRGQPTNKWSPTHARVSSGHALSFNIEIATTPADLEALGLEKKSGDTQRTGVEGPVHGDQETFLADFLMPGYPSLARTSGVQGEVKVAVELDSKCQVSTSQILAGHPLLNSTVLEAIQGWHFTSCAAGGGKVDVVFHFVLVEPDVPARDDWAPTHLEMTGPYEFRIKTMVPPDPTIYG